MDIKTCQMTLSLSLILSSHGRTWDHLDVWLGAKPRSHEDREMDQHDVAVNEHGFIMIYSCQVISAIKKNIIQTKNMSGCCCCCCFRKGPKLFRWLMAYGLQVHCARKLQCPTHSGHQRVLGF